MASKAHAVVGTGLVLFALAAGPVGCRRPPATAALHLVDLYKPADVEGRAPATEPPQRTEWRFDSAGAKAWEAFHEVAGLAVRGGRLVGRATGELPILHFERTTGLDDKDVVHEIQIRIRVSAGANLSVTVAGAPKVDRDEAMDYARNFPWDFTTPIVAGDELRTYTLKTPFSRRASSIRHVFVRPTDQAGATFEIESFRVVFRREHLASIASGVGWQGLSELYRETIVGRSPETARLKLAVPEGAWLSLGVGTVDEGTVTFRVVARRPGSLGETTLLTRTVTRPHRWEDVSLDMAPLAGSDAELLLSVAAEKPGTIGLWGSPVVRTRGARPGGAGSARGVILVWTDTLRRDHLGAYGYARPTSPNIDRLAAEGTLFRDCVGQASWTKVATPSLLTSLYPTSHGVLDFSDRLPASAHTLAESYRAAGYATLSLSSILFTGKFSNLHQGFEVVHEGSSLADPDSSKTSRDYVDRLVAWLEANRDFPFFVFLHVADPHDPYRPKPPYDTLFADAARTEEHERQGQALKKTIADPLLRHMGSPMGTREELVQAGLDPEAYVGHDRDWYDGSIRGMDAELGRLVERLRALGLDREVLLVVTGDHGEEFLDHGRMCHGQSVYGEMNNMALLFWGPGRVASGTVDETVQTIDVMPTLLEASGLGVPAEAQGRSLWSRVAATSTRGGVRADDRAGVPAISEKNVTVVPAGGPPPRDTESFAIVLGGWKLIHNTKLRGAKPEYELYDHKGDPRDAKDVAAAHPEIVERLAKDLDAWHRKAVAARLKPDANAAVLSGEELERLRALGYVQ